VRPDQSCVAGQWVLRCSAIVSVHARNRALRPALRPTPRCCQQQPAAAPLRPRGHAMPFLACTLPPPGSQTPTPLPPPSAYHLPQPTVNTLLRHPPALESPPARPPLPSTAPAPACRGIPSPPLARPAPTPLLRRPWSASAPLTASACCRRRCPTCSASAARPSSSSMGGQP
jgi:hypothetical protein